jgi:hypothetical protein
VGEGAFGERVNLKPHRWHIFKYNWYNIPFPHRTKVFLQQDLAWDLENEFPYTLTP